MTCQFAGAPMWLWLINVFVIGAVSGALYVVWPILWPALRRMLRGER